MVDRESRTRACELIGKFADGALTNDEFDDQYPESKDRGVQVVLERLWFFWDDLKTHRLEGAYQLDAESKKLLNRCTQFLATDLEYAGPAIGGTLFSGIKKTWKGLFGEAALAESEGDVNAPWWPFTSEEQYRQYTATAVS
jgi:hypothetical protein